MTTDSVCAAQVRLLNGFEQDCRNRRFLPKTVRDYTADVGRYLGVCDDVDIFSENTHSYHDYKPTLMAFLDDLTQDGLSEHTIENYFSSISAFYSYLIEEDRARLNPVEQFRKRYLCLYKTDKEERQIVEQDTLEEILDGMSGGYQAAALLLAKSAMRREECLATVVGDFDLNRQMLYLQKNPNARKRSNRRIPLDRQTVAVLRMYWKQRADAGETVTAESAAFVTKRGKRIIGEHLRRAVSAAAMAAGAHDPKGPLCKRFTPHCFRHWATTTLLASGMSPAYVDEIRGDKREGSREVYNHISDRKLVEELEKHMPVLQFTLHPYQ